MSITRWGADNSDVYIIVTCENKELAWQCVGCKLPNATVLKNHGPSKFMDHVNLHKSNGDHVPDYVTEQCLIDEMRGL